MSLKGVWKLSEGCLARVGGVPGVCLEGVWRMSEGCLEGAWRVSMG